MKKFLTAPLAAVVLAGTVATAQAAMIVPAQYTTGVVASANEAAQTATIGKDVYYGVTGVNVGTDVTFAFVIEGGKRVVVGVTKEHEAGTNDILPTD